MRNEGPCIQRRTLLFHVTEGKIPKIEKNKALKIEKHIHRQLTSIYKAKRDSFIFRLGTDLRLTHRSLKTFSSGVAHIFKLRQRRGLCHRLSHSLNSKKPSSTAFMSAWSPWIIIFSDEWGVQSYRGYVGCQRTNHLVFHEISMIHSGSSSLGKIAPLERKRNKKRSIDLKKAKSMRSTRLIQCHQCAHKRQNHLGFHLNNIFRQYKDSRTHFPSN